MATKKSAGLCEGAGSWERAAEAGGRKEEKLPHVIIQTNRGLSSLFTMYNLCLSVQTRLYLHSAAKWYNFTFKGSFPSAIPHPISPSHSGVILQASWVSTVQPLLSGIKRHMNHCPPNTILLSSRPGATAQPYTRIQGRALAYILWRDRADVVFYNC